MPTSSAISEPGSFETITTPALEVYDPVHYPLEEYFAPGVYMREIFMPEGHFIVGCRHKTEHLNIITQGGARVMIGDEIKDLQAPCTFVSAPGVRKVLYITRDCRWITIHPTDERDPDKLRETLIFDDLSATDARAAIEQCRARLLQPPTT